MGHTPLREHRQGAHLPVGGYTTLVCEARPVRRGTYAYLPSRRASPPLDWYPITLLGDRGTLATCV